MYRDELEAAHSQLNSMRGEIKRLGDENKLLELENDHLRHHKKEERKTKPFPTSNLVWFIILAVFMAFDVYQVVIGKGWWLTYVAIGLVGSGLFFHGAAIVRRE